MPHTSDDTLGRRRFQLSRDQAIEAAIEKIRHAPDADWHSFSGSDYTCLRSLLGDLWVHLERERWKEYTFSTLTRDDIRDLLALCRSAQGRTLPRNAVEEMDAILSHSRRTPKKP
jgi:hypothetical protein